MNSSKTTLRRIQLDDSPTTSHRSIQSIVEGLSLISMNDGVEEWANILESSAGRISVAGNEGRESDCGGFRWTGERGEVDRYATWTECLGFESLSETAGGFDVTEEPPARSGSRSGNIEWRGRKRRPKTLRNYPPLLSTLNENGRPRFYFRKVRKEGLLQIVKLPSDRPVVRSLRGNDRLRIVFINAAQDDEEEIESTECDEEITTTTTTEDQGRVEKQFISADRDDKEEREEDDRLQMQLVDTNEDETIVNREGDGADQKATVTKGDGWRRCEGGGVGDGCLTALFSPPPAMIC